MAETARPSRLHGRSQELFDAMKQAGIVRDGDYVRRVIIDICAERAVIVYVERYGDERLLDVVRTMDGAEIRGVPASEPLPGPLIGYIIGGKTYAPDDVRAVYREE